MRRHWIPTALAAVLVAGAAVAPGQPAAAQQSTWYGFHQDLDYYGTSSGPRVDAVASIGAQVSRSTLLWRDHEPSQGTFDWTKSDFVQNELQSQGITPLWYIGCSPSWANGSSDCWQVPSYPSSSFDTWRDRVAIFAAAAANRYPGQMWEVWNEPNEFHFWKPTPNQDAYSDLYRAVRSAILAADPTAMVAVGGITSINVGCGPPQCIDGYDFIEGMLQDGDPMDFVGVHAYAGQNQAPDACISGERSFRDLALARVLLNSYGRSGVPLWLTELGWPSTLGESTQAQYLTQAHTMLQSGSMTTCPEHGSQTVSLNLTVSNWFFDIDTPSFQGWGVFRTDLTRKPAADAFEDFIEGAPGGEQIVDELGDWSESFSHSADLSFDTSQADRFGGDGSRAVRTAPGAKWIVWRLDGMDTFNATAWFWPGEPIKHFQIQTSADTQTWTTRSPAISVQSGNWTRVTYQLTGLTGANYINLVWMNDPGQVWAPQIGRVVVTS